MGLLDEQIYQHLPAIGIGIAAGLLTQVLVMAVLASARPLAKTAIKSGFIVMDAVSGAYSLAESQLGKLTGEAVAKAPRRLPKPKSGNPELN